MARRREHKRDSKERDKRRQANRIARTEEEEFNSEGRDNRRYRK